MGKHIVDEDELKERAKFFSKYILGIPFEYDIIYVDPEDESGAEVIFYGAFVSTGEAYEYDDELGEFKDCHIEINRCLDSDVLRLNNVLLHELIHFKLWYLGYDYHDNETQFNETLKKYHVSSSSDKKYNKKLGIYEDIINVEYMQKYEEMFQNRTSN